MTDLEINRRDLMITAVAGGATGVLGFLGGRSSRAAAANKLQVKIAGYAYDRVRAIQDGRLGLDRFNTSFHVEAFTASTRISSAPRGETKSANPV